MPPAWSIQSSRIGKPAEPVVHSRPEPKFTSNLQITAKTSIVVEGVGSIHSDDIHYQDDVLQETSHRKTPPLQLPRMMQLS
jgi:hypothetical protein